MNYYEEDAGKVGITFEHYTAGKAVEVLTLVPYEGELYVSLRGTVMNDSIPSAGQDWFKISCFGDLLDAIKKVKADSEGLLVNIEAIKDECMMRLNSMKEQIDGTIIDIRQRAEEIMRDLVATDHDAKANEDLRKAGEEVRKAGEEERKKAEALRYSAELLRDKAEGERAIAENQRIAKENERNEAWAHLQTEINSTVQTAGEAAERAVEAAQQVDVAIRKANEAAEHANEEAGKIQPALDAMDAVFKSKEQRRDELVEEATHLAPIVNFFVSAMGKYDGVGTKLMNVKVNGKAIGTDGREFTKTGYAISDKIQVNRGDILVFKSSQVLPTDVSFFNRAVTRTYNKIDHYEYEYDEEGNITKETPVFVEVTESFYEALSQQSVAAMPGTGYVYLCPTTMEIVVSGLAGDITGKNLEVYGVGIFKNMATNFVGAPGQRIIAQAFLQLIARIEALESLVDKLGALRCSSLSVDDIPMVCGSPLILYGHGVPADGNVPDNWNAEMGEWNGCPCFIGQKYINLDAAANGEYYANGTDAVSNWKQA